MSARKSVGILLPDDGPDDYEWHVLGEMIADPPPVVVGRVTSDGLHEDSALRSLGRVSRLLPQAQALVSGGCASLLWACTSASFIGGLKWAVAQSEELSRMSGVPASSTALAFRDALLEGGWRRVDLLSPYPTSVTNRLAAFLQECGISVRNAHSLDNLYASHSHEIDLIGEVQAFRSRRDGPTLPVVIPDTAVNTLGCWQDLMAAADAPVITANQVTLWKALKLLNWAGSWPSCLGPLLARN